MLCYWLMYSIYLYVQYVTSSLVASFCFFFLITRLSVLIFFFVFLVLFCNFVFCFVYSVFLDCFVFLPLGGNEIAVNKYHMIIIRTLWCLWPLDDGPRSKYQLCLKPGSTSFSISHWLGHFVDKHNVTYASDETLLRESKHSWTDSVRYSHTVWYCT